MVYMETSILILIMKLRRQIKNSSSLIDKECRILKLIKNEVKIDLFT